MLDGTDPIGPRRLTALLLAPSLLTAQLMVPAFALNPATVAAFDRYIALTESRIDADTRSPDTFLAIDHLPPNRRKEAVRRLQHGEAIVETTESLDAGRAVRIPGALIQHVRGTIFVPDISIDDALRAVKDYDRYPQWFPDVVSSRVVERDGDDFLVSTRIVKGRFTTVALDIDRDVHFATLDPKHVVSRSSARQILGIRSPGAATERRRHSQNVWRLNNYGWFVQSDEGVYCQVEVISLSRDVPTGLNWMMALVQRVEKTEVEHDLAAMRTLLLRSSRVRTSGP